MSLTLKIGSLAIRTLAKPIANIIKRNAREHQRFRRIAIDFAQTLHRIDMRMRLGLLQDPAVIERQIKKEAQEAEARRKKSLIPTVKTEEETRAEEKEKAKEWEDAEKKVKKANRPRIRPLTEEKAIDSGANFISESFLFAVACGIILFENWRSRRKEKNRREDVAERIDSLESKILRLESELHEERPKGSPSDARSEDAPPTRVVQGDADQRPIGSSQSQSEAKSLQDSNGDSAKVGSRETSNASAESSIRTPKSAGPASTVHP